MLPTPNTLDMARRLPNNELVIYPDAGHGGIFQFHEQFVEKALEFLANSAASSNVCLVRSLRLRRWLRVHRPQPQ
jgi:hypothetical protein